MRKTIAWLLVIGIYLVIGNWLFAIESYALSATQEAEIRLEVSSIFNLSIDQGFIDFEKMKPGDVKWNLPYSALTTTCQTNRDNPWYLKISNEGALSSGMNTISNSNFYWYGWTEGSGIWYGLKENILNTTPTIVYSASAGEYSNYPAGTKNAFKFKLKVPADAKPGVYKTAIKFTMTE